MASTFLISKQADRQRVTQGKFDTTFDQLDAGTMGRPAVAFTEQEFMSLGLSFLRRRFHRMKPHVQARVYKRVYGTSAKIHADVWSRLRSSPDQETAIDEYCKPTYLLLFYRWTKRYATELELSTLFDLCENTIKTWNRKMAMKISSLRQSVVSMYYIVKCPLTSSPS